MLNYPLVLSFKIIAFNPQVKVTDTTGQTVAYVRQQALKLREDVRIFADEAQQRQLFQMRANTILDFNTNYTITTPDGGAVGAVRRQGLRSLWKTHYEIIDASGNDAGLIHEENPWTKVADALVGEIPVVGIFAGMFLNPAYLVDLRGATALYLKKQPAMLEGKFTVEKRGAFSDGDESLLLSSIIMMLMLERSRG